MANKIPHPQRERGASAPQAIGSALATFEEKSSGRIILAVVDIVDKAIDVVHIQEPEYEGQWAFWVALGDDFLFVDRANGAVRLFDADSKTMGQTLIPPQELIINPMVASLLKSNKSFMRVKHHFRADTPLSLDAGFVLRIIETYQDQKPEKTRYVRIEPGTRRVETVINPILIDDPDLFVIHDTNEGEIRFTKNPR